jgi:hypothetical protein
MPWMPAYIVVLNLLSMISMNFCSIAINSVEIWLYMVIAGAACHSGNPGKTRSGSFSKFILYTYLFYCSIGRNYCTIYLIYTNILHSDNFYLSAIWILKKYRTCLSHLNSSYSLLFLKNLEFYCVINIFYTGKNSFTNATLYQKRLLISLNPDGDFKSVVKVNS